MKKIFATITTLLLLTGLGAGVWYFLQSQQPEPANPRPKVEAPKVVKEPEKLSDETLQGAFNLALIGTDNRAGQRYQDSVEGELNDVTMIIRINSTHTAADVISIPRDLIAPLGACTTGEPGTDFRQFNEGLGLGGPACVLAASEELIQEPIHGYAVVNFNAVEDLTTAVGGVTVNIPEQILDPKTGEVLFEAGENVIQGEDALSFVRERKGFGDGGDLGRINHQQLLISSFLDEFNLTGTLLNPVKFWKLTDATLKNLTLSENLASPGTLLKVANTVKQIGPNNFSFHTVPTVTHPDNPNRLAVDQAALEAMLATPVPDTPVAPDDTESALIGPTPEEG